MLNKLKNKRGQAMGKLGIILMLFILIILGVVFAGAIFDQQSQMTDKNSVTNESFNLSSNGCYDVNGDVDETSADCNLTVANWYDSDDWKASTSECYLSSVTVTDGTGTELTEDTDYVLNEDEGKVQMLNTTDTDDLSEVLVDYEYCPFGYVVDGGARSIAGLVGLFFVLALFVTVAVNPALREWFEDRVLGR